MQEVLKRSNLIQLRCGAREKALIRAGAIAADLTISELVREAAKAEARRLLSATERRP